MAAAAPTAPAIEAFPDQLRQALPDLSVGENACTQRDASGECGSIGAGQRPVGDGKVYLCYLRHRFIDFRLAELRALLDMFCGSSDHYQIWGEAADWDRERGFSGGASGIGTCIASNGSGSGSKEDGLGGPPQQQAAKDDGDDGSGGGDDDELMSPFCYLRLPSPEVAQRVAERAMLVKAIIELWGEGSTMDELVSSAGHDPEGTKSASLSKDRSFKVQVECFAHTASPRDKLAWINRCTTLLPVRARVDLDNPDEVLWLVVSAAATLSHRMRAQQRLTTEPDRWYYGRQVAYCSRLGLIQRYELPQRRYLGPTSMDCEMAFIMANLAQVRQSQVAFDPFVGTGSCLVAAAHFGAYTMGADIDLRVVRDGKMDKEGRPVNVWSNFADYGLSLPLMLLRADAHRMPWRRGLEELVDCIVCDPPYGVRAGGRKGAKRDYKVHDTETHIPPTDPYTLGECLRDLLESAALLLRPGGRLVYFYPAAPELYSEEEIPRHPCLRLVENCEQMLTPRYSRRLLVMTKVARYDKEQAAEFYAMQGEPRLSVDLLHELVFEPKQYDDQGRLVNEQRVLAIKKKFRSKCI